MPDIVWIVFVAILATACLFLCEIDKNGSEK